MSHRDFIGFLEAINTDVDLSRRVEAIQDGTMDEKVEQFIELGRQLGFAFTEEEMDEFLLAHAAGESGEELSPEALDAVAGGLQNRRFTVLSNIMKVRHDTAKAVINNIR